jgi:hypothetical protein
MKNCVSESDHGPKIVTISSDDEEAIEECELTCNWAVYNRLFSAPDSYDFGIEESTGTLSVTNETKYYVGKPAERLLELIEEAGRIMYYQ